MFKVGDSVRCVVERPENNKYISVGSTGTIVLLCMDYIGVEWDDYVYGHSCNKEAEEGHGWNVSSDEIELYEDGQYEFNEDEFKQLIGF